ncbi:hypothetical protein E4U13_001677 [Claviceps humidiphila]|uniref:Protein required for hyphal anastomosis (HAM-2) n=1 Tax=Claviceps humidiphila TaxID=1294629 RepID=A0A9P7Q133_9HYPO|nr:hypothetical protein E4U13_001677 [Claviceps humidiphila]
MWPASGPVPGLGPDPPQPVEDTADTGVPAASGQGTEHVEESPVAESSPSLLDREKNPIAAGLAAAAEERAEKMAQKQRQKQEQREKQEQRDKQEQQEKQEQRQKQQQQQQQQNPPPTDSLSLVQLRRIVAEAGRAEPVPYDFVYEDMGPHAEEIDEWFVYQFWQWVRLNAAQTAFEWHWNQETDGQASWDDADQGTRTRFVRAAIAGVQSNDAALKSASIGKIVYLVLGRWGDTAMATTADEESRSIASASQLQAIKEGVKCLTSLEALPVVWEALRSCFESHWSGDIHEQASPQEAQDELMNLMTIMYIAIQETLNDPEDTALSYKALLELEPSLVDYMLITTSKLRWDDQNAMPLTQIFLLFWKSILLVFGGTNDLAALKEVMSEMKEDGSADKTTTITASPLDYHVFRQEITSKYPAYIPPQPRIPIEDENNSLLPPIPNQTWRLNSNNGIISTPGLSQSGGASILNQPVHIATPAPSPPPSPGPGGKSAKKQNYQTNQNFPFMYPPLDATSNSAGGKGMAGIDESIVSRRWEGSDIPASILEAGELFSTRVRMTRAMRQMWEAREQFLQFERGWAEDDDDDDDDDLEEDHGLGDDDVESLLDLVDLTPEEREILREVKAVQHEITKSNRSRKSTARPIQYSHTEVEIDFGPHPERLSERDKQRLVAVERFYKEALPHLQSLVIVLLRPILVNVTAVVAQQSNQQMQMNAGGPMAGGRGYNSSGPYGNAPRGMMDQSGQIMAQEELEPSPEEVDAARTREITTKAMTGILVLLLKWLRLSHVLKFEYLTQLLLDSNYIPLVLKLFAHQDVQQVVDSKMDRVENSFFQFCNLRSKFRDKSESDLENENEESCQVGEAAQTDPDGQQKPPHESELDSAQDSDDDAAPPPIKRNRPSAKATEAQDTTDPRPPTHMSERDAKYWAAYQAWCQAEAETIAQAEARSKQREAAAKEESNETSNPDENEPPANGNPDEPDQLSREQQREEEDTSGGGGPPRPRVDELGYPINPVPEEQALITDFSWRNFFSLINYLRVLQKMCKNKAHRNLFLVQYKSSTILRKALRVPQPQLRLYTLKLVKNQVPYCGRKWRQSNMRVITAIYLHCRPELRDEWLAGSDIDADVDSALPLEQALRGLTHWINLRRYPDKIARDLRAALREEQDFFSRELERLEGGLGGWGDEREEGMGMEHHHHMGE